MNIERPKDLKLGGTGRDKISGFQGVVIAITEWLNGCLRYTLQPQELKDGKPIESFTFDAEQVESVGSSPELASVPHGGPSIAPNRKSDPV